MASTNGVKHHDTCIRIEDDFKGYPVDSLDLPDLYKDDLDHLLIPAGFVRDRTRKLAKEIAEYFQKEPILAVCVLKGAYRFFSELLEEMKQFQPGPVSMDFIRLKSYMDTESVGDVKVIGTTDLLSNMGGRNILIVEDIIDTGRTMKKLIAMINELSDQEKPKSVKVVSLLLKRTPKSCGYRPDFVGFDIPDRFVVGLAFDYNEMFRDLNHICILNKAAIRKYAISA